MLRVEVLSHVMVAELDGVIMRFLACTVIAIRGELRDLGCELRAPIGIRHVTRLPCRRRNCLICVGAAA